MYHGRKGFPDECIAVETGNGEEEREIAGIALTYRRVNVFIRPVRVVQPPSVMHD